MSDSGEERTLGDLVKEMVPHAYPVSGVCVCVCVCVCACVCVCGMGYERGGANPGGSSQGDGATRIPHLRCVCVCVCVCACVCVVWGMRGEEVRGWCWRFRGEASVAESATREVVIHAANIRVLFFLQNS